MAACCLALLLVVGCLALSLPLSLRNAQPVQAMSMDGKYCWQVLLAEMRMAERQRAWQTDSALGPHFPLYGALLCELVFQQLLYANGSMDRYFTVSMFHLSYVPNDSYF